MAVFSSAETEEGWRRRLRMALACGVAPTERVRGMCGAADRMAFAVSSRIENSLFRHSRAVTGEVPW